MGKVVIVVNGLFIQQVEYIKGRRKENKVVFVLSYCLCEKLQVH